MLDLKSLLKISYFNSIATSYTDASVVLGNPLGSTFVISEFVENDFLYIGYHKPIKNIYFEIKVPNALSNLKFEVSTETGWSEIQVVDETNNFAQSGMIQWLEVSNPALAVVDSNSLHWLRISANSVLTEDITFAFIGLILSVDQDLVIENPYILDQNLLLNQTSHINAHVAARNEILQSFRNKGDGFCLWDVLNIQEFKQASLFLALSKIYHNLSDNTDDTWMQKSREYRKMYLDSVNLYWKTIDKNNNGKVDAGENAVSRTKTLFR